jgi:hypothetical protein
MSLGSKEGSEGCREVPYFWQRKTCGRNERERNDEAKRHTGDDTV